MFIGFEKWLKKNSNCTEKSKQEREVFGEYHEQFRELLEGLKMANEDRPTIITPTFTPHSDCCSCEECNTTSKAKEEDWEEVATLAADIERRKMEGANRDKRFDSEELHQGGDAI